MIGRQQLQIRQENISDDLIDIVIVVSELRCVQKYFPVNSSGM